MKIPFLFLPVVLLISTSGLSKDVQYIYMDELPASADYAADFLNVSQTVKKHYTHLENKKINTGELEKKYLQEIQTLKTSIDYGWLLLRYFAELRNSHTGVIFKRYYKSCSAALIEDRVFLSSVRDSVFLLEGIQPKDEIVKINNQPVMEYIREQAKYISSSTDLHGKYMAVSYLFYSYVEEPRTYTILTSSGEKNVTVHFSKPKPVPASTSVSTSRIESKLLRNDIGYISILGMTGTVVEDFAAAYDSLSGKPYLIIDLRRNQGGNSGFSEKIAEYLIRNSQAACVSKRTLNPKSNHYTGKLIVLTSPYTFSAAESFAIDLLESGVATFVGMPTGGDTGNQPKIYESDLGYRYRFPSRKKPGISEKGFPMEGRSIHPHHVVETTVVDYRSGNDTVLNAVLGLTGEK